MDSLSALGADASRLRVLRNGVDLERFRPLAADDCRRELGLPAQGTLLLSVGHLVERKGHHFAIDALADLPDARLAVVGDGGMRGELEARAAKAGIAGRVVFAGARPNAELARWYSAADALILASSREGWANVLLESMACGTPVVATRIWGTPEVVAAPEAGELVEERTGAAIAAGVKKLLARRPARETVRRYAEGFGWEPISRAQLELFGQIAAHRRLVVA